MVADFPGDCTGEEVCSAMLPIMDIYAANADKIDSQDATAGMCVVPKAAGSSCTAGSGKICPKIFVIMFLVLLTMPHQVKTPQVAVQICAVDMEQTC